MTTLQLPLRTPAFDRGLSAAADQLRSYGRPAWLETSVTLSAPEEKMQAALAHAWEIAATIDAATQEYAWRLLAALPFRQRQAVDIQIDPAGEVMFEWAASPRWLLTLTINGFGRIAYSGIYGSSRTRGTELFEDTVPDSIALAIARVGNA
jgi:hypothetical protein